MRLDRLVETGDRRFVLTKRHQDDAAVGQSVGRQRIEQRRLVEQYQRFSVLALLMQQNTEIMQCGEIIRLLPQRVAIDARGIVKHPRLV